MDSAIRLLDFLNAEGDRAVDTLTPALAAAGVDVGKKLGGPTTASREAAAAAADAGARASLLIRLALQALGRAVDGFDRLIDEVKRRIRRAQTLRRTAAIVTTVLSSGVVASLNLAKGSGWSLGLGVLALLASILALVASWLEGGDAKLAEQFADVSQKYAQALALRERLQAYAATPLTFPDIDERLAEADRLVADLQKTRAAWSIA
jgi:hypothetical protein